MQNINLRFLLAKLFSKKYTHWNLAAKQPIRSYDRKQAFIVFYKYFILYTVFRVVRPTYLFFYTCILTKSTAKETRINIYKAMVVTEVMYGRKSWMLSEKDNSRVQANKMRWILRQTLETQMFGRFPIHEINSGEQY